MAVGNVGWGGSLGVENKAEFCEAVFTFNKPYSHTFIRGAQINAYLIVTYLKTIFSSTGYQSVLRAAPKTRRGKFPMVADDSPTRPSPVFARISVYFHNARQWTRLPVKKKSNDGKNPKRSLRACANEPTPQEQLGGEMNQVVLLIAGNAFNHPLIAPHRLCNIVSAAKVFFL